MKKNMGVGFRREELFRVFIDLIDLSGSIFR